jgi:hypothetical protein
MLTGIKILPVALKSLESSVGIVTGYELNGRSPILDTGKKNVFSTASRPTLGKRLASYQMGVWYSFFRSKATGV